MDKFVKVKRAVSIFSMFLVLTVMVGNIGFFEFKHFCSTEGESSSFFYQADTECISHEFDGKEDSCCDEKESLDTPSAVSNCCTNETLIHQLKFDDYRVNHNISLLSTPIFTEKYSFYSSINQITDCILTENLNHNSPPPDYKHPIYIKNQVFVI